MTRLLFLATILFSVALFGATSTKVGGSGTTKVGGSGTTKTGGFVTRFLNDTFTDADSTSIANHAGEVAGAWTLPTGFSGSAIITSNRVRSSAAAVARFRSAAYPLSADYSVSAVLSFFSSVSPNYTGVIGRVTHDGTAGYYAAYLQFNNTWALYSIAGGSLGAYAQTLTASQDYIVTLDMKGTSIRLLVDGVERVSVTNSAVTAAGSPGIICYGVVGTSTGMHISQVYADQATPILPYSTNYAFALVGDSISGDFSLPGTATIAKLLGISTRWNTGIGWNVSVVGERADQMDTTQVPQVVARYAATAAFGRRVVVVFAGRNDISAGDSSATVLTEVTALHTDLRAAGFATVAVPPIKWSGISGPTETIRLAVRTGILNGDTGADYIADLEASFPDASDATKFTDGLHLTVLGRDLAAAGIAAAVPAP